MNKFAIILAAGKGTRMKSDLPKVLHPVCGKPMVQHLVNKLEKMNMDRIIVVVGHGAEEVKKQIKGNVEFVEQSEQLGTGHAVMQTADLLKGEKGTTVVVTGDTPLIEEETLLNLLGFHKEKNAKGTVLTTRQPNPTGYGRILRGIGNRVIGIVEEKDATEEQKTVKEVNTGIFCFDNELLFQAISSLRNDNAQHEYYLTDIVSVFADRGIAVEGCVLADNLQMLGVNSRSQLAQAEKVMRHRINEHHMENGVTLIDPENTYIEEEVVIGADTIIYPNVVIQGATIIGERCTIHTGTEISHSIIGNETVIKQSVIADSHIGSQVTIGPFAHIRPNTVIQNKAKIGNFVELKGSTIGEGSKANHLSYIGDADVGSGVNIGCGTITVNYDGEKKHKTIIEDRAFIGCNSNLIAPIIIGEESIIAAGSTITKDVPKHALGIARSRQENKENYTSKLKNK